VPKEDPPSLPVALFFLQTEPSPGGLNEGKSKVVGKAFIFAVQISSAQSDPFAVTFADTSDGALPITSLCPVLPAARAAPDKARAMTVRFPALRQHGQTTCQALAPIGCHRRSRHHQTAKTQLKAVLPA